MAQTVGQITGRDFKIELSFNGTTWYDISGSTNMIEQPARSWEVGTVYTGDGQFPLITIGPNAPMTLTINAIYTESTAETWVYVETAVLSWNNKAYLRYSPRGGGAGTSMFTTSDAAGSPAAALVTNLQYPGADAAASTAMLAAFTLTAQQLVRSVIV